MEQIKFEDMVACLAKDGEDIIKGLTPESAHLWHMATGVSGEVGELIENYLYHGDHDNRVEELGDIEFYAEGIKAKLPHGSILGRDASGLTANAPTHLLHLALRSSQLLDTIKKHAIYEKPLDVTQVTQDLNSLYYELHKMYNHLCINRSTAIKANINKLGERYKGFTYSNKAAQKRADKEGEK